MKTLTTQKFAELNKIKICYSDSGNKEGIPIVFIHSLGLNKEIWFEQETFFKDKFRIITLDLRGHGNSDVSDGHYSIDYFVEDIIALLDHLQIEKAILCGMLMGGYIALRTIDLYPARITALILCDTKSYADSNSEKIKRFHSVKQIKKHGTDEFATEMLNNLFSKNTLQNKMETVNFIKNSICLTSVVALSGTLLALAGRIDTSECLKKIKVPVLIISGVRDELSVPFDAQYLNHFIHGSQIHIVPDSGSLTNIEHAENFNNAVLNFFNKKVWKEGLIEEGILEKTYI